MEVTLFRIPCNKVILLPGANVTDRDSIRIFDENTTELLGESRTVVNHGVVTNADGTITVTLNSALTRSYWASKNTNSQNPLPTFDNYHSGGVGVNGSGAYDANTGSLDQAFGDAYVEFVTALTAVSRNGNGDVPFLASSFFNNTTGDTRTPVAYFGRIWFANCSQGDFYHCLNDNKFHIVGIEADTSNPADWGFTYKQDHHSFVNAGTIETKPCNTIANCKMFTTSHEIAHQFHVNACDCLGHDEKLAWCAGSVCAADQQCLMYSLTIPQRQDGV